MAGCLLVAAVSWLAWRYVSQTPNPSVDYVARFNEEFLDSHAPNAAPLYQRALPMLDVPRGPSLGFGAANPFAWYYHPTHRDLDAEAVLKWADGCRGGFDVLSEACEIERGVFQNGDAFERLSRGNPEPGIHPPSRSRLGKAERRIWEGSWLWKMNLASAAWALRARRAAAGGEIEEARRCYGRALRMAHHLYQFPLYLPQYHGAQCELAAHITWSEICFDFPEAAELPLLPQLEQMARWPSLQAIIRAEEYLHLDKLQALFTDDGSGDGH